MTTFDLMLIEMAVLGFIDGLLCATAIFLAIINRRLKKRNKERKENGKTKHS